MTKKINQDNIDTEFKCPVETALDVLAGKWKILIIWYLKDEKKRFNPDYAIGKFQSKQIYYKI